MALELNKNKQTNKSPPKAGDWDIRWTPGWWRSPGEGKLQLTSASLPGESHGQRNLVGSGPVQFILVAQSCLTLCDPMDCTMPGFPVHHQLPEPTQTHVHWVGDAIQPSHSLSPPSPAFNLSQNLGLFQWVGSLHQAAKVLEFQLQYQSFQWIFKIDFL